MVEPVTTGIASAVAAGAVDYIRDYIQESDDPEKAWKEAAQECIIQARVTFQQKYQETPVPDLSELKAEIGTIGQSARELSVRGELREYDEHLIELIGEFATACAHYSDIPSMSDGKSEDEFETKLNELGPQILNETD